MTTEPTSARALLERVSTGVAGLDIILRGGFLRDGIFIVQGMPGAGKTIFGNQACFNHIRAGGRALYVTLLAETHPRMLMHIGQLSFFDASVIPAKLTYISGFRVLEEAGFKGLLDLLRHEVQAREATMMVLDGLVAAQETSATPREFKKFLTELQTQATMTGCTVLLLTAPSADPAPPEHTMVDGVIELSSRLYGRRSERDLHVLKMRGGGFLHGVHSSEITDDGLVVYPRTEAWLALPTAEDQVDGPPITTGIATLDVMMGGGLPRHSTTLLMGPTGTGKTTLGLHFLSQCSQEEAGLYFGLYESRSAIIAKAKALGLPVLGLIEDGQVELMWQPTTEGMLDEVCQRLLNAVRRRHVKRLFIDGLGGFETLAADPARLSHVFTALSNEFRVLDVTVIYTAEADLIGSVSGLPLSGLSLEGVPALAENIVIMRFVQLRSRVHRVISVLKVRDRPNEPTVRAFLTTSTGLAIEPDATGAEAILAEAAQQAPFRTPKSSNRRGA